MNGKGSSPRNCFSKQYKENYDYIFRTTMSYYLFLDDQRIPSDVSWIDLPIANWDIVRSYDEFIDIINKNGIPQFIRYDHDLGPQAMTEIISNDFKSFDY